MDVLSKQGLRFEVWLIGLSSKSTKTDSTLSAEPVLAFKYYCHRRPPFDYYQKSSNYLAVYKRSFCFEDSYLLVNILIIMLYRIKTSNISD